MKKGFTLIELLVVVLIIGILASIAVPQYNKAVMKARTAEVMTTANALRKATSVYFMNVGEMSQQDYDNFELDFLDIEIPELKYHNFNAGTSGRTLLFEFTPKTGSYNYSIDVYSSTSGYNTNCEGSDCKLISSCAPIDVGCPTYGCKF